MKIKRSGDTRNKFSTVFKRCFKTALNTLTLDAELRIKMGQNARIVAEQNTWVSKAQHYINLFEEVVNGERYQSCDTAIPVEQSIMLKV